MASAEGAGQGEAALRASLEDRGFAYSRIVGDSMLPSLRGGDMVLLEPCTRLRPGEIITFRLGDGLVTHRVLSVDESIVVCRGDNRPRADPPVAREAVIARVVQLLGRPLPDRPHDVLRVRLQHRRRELMARLVRVRDEGALIVGSVRGRSTREIVDAPVRGYVEGATGGAGEYVVRPADLAASDSLPMRRADEVLVIPASLYGGLPPKRRREIMQSLTGRRLHVYGLPLASAGRVTRLTAHVRKLLQAFGFRGGQPGDMAVRDGAGLHTLHTFTVAELERELEGFGLGSVTVETVVTEAGPLLRATAGPD